MVARTWLFLSAALLIAGSGIQPVAAAPGDVGTPAAGFTLNAFQGGTHSLSDHSGQVVMLFVIGYG